MLNQKVMDEMFELYELLAKYDESYFNQDNPLIEDKEYDALRARFNKMIEEYPLEYKELYLKDDIILSDINTSVLDLDKHDKRMLSLDKINTMASLESWLNQSGIKDNKLIYEYKLDGLAISCIYSKGKLIKVLTRGDGELGEDVIRNISLFNNLPEFLEIEADVIIRGEAVISFENFNSIQKLTNNKYKNPRNCCAGLVRSLNLDLSDLEGLVSFIVYDAVGAYTENFITYSSMLSDLRKYGLETPPTADLEVIKNNTGNKRYPTDGVVIKIDDLLQRDYLGTTNKHPKWAIAYKFENQTKETTLKAVNWQVGRTGVITPVAEYEPVIINGNTYSFATLHNYRNLATFGLYYGCKIIVSLANEIIPQITGMIASDDEDVEHVKAPSRCPACNSKLLFDGANDEEIILRCNNTLSCPSQVINRIINFVSKRCLDINGLGKINVYKLYDSGKLTSLVDIFKLTKEDLVESGIIGKLADNIIESISKSIGCPAYKLLCGFGIPEVGIGVSKDICSTVGNDDELLSLLVDFDRLVKINGVGVGISLEIKAVMSNEHFNKEFKELLKILKVTYGTLSNVNLEPICITGSFPMPRDELRDLLEPKGYEVIDRVTNKTVALITGTRPSNNKILKAVKQGIPVFDGLDSFLEK